jgi:hypothetical protein
MNVFHESSHPLGHSHHMRSTETRLPMIPISVFGEYITALKMTSRLSQSLPALPAVKGCGKD